MTLRFPLRSLLPWAACLALGGCPEKKAEPGPEVLLLEKTLTIPPEVTLSEMFSLEDAKRVHLKVDPVDTRSGPFTVGVLVADEVRNFTFNHNMDEVHPLVLQEKVAKVDHRTLMVAGAWGIAVRNPSQQPLAVHIRLTSQ